jgi:uncharacterized protein
MNLSMIALPAAVMAVMALPATASAASFDCGKAARPDEKAICASRSLSEMDVQMAALYGVRMQLPMAMGARGAAYDEQQRFLAARAACGADNACLETAYRARIAKLKSILSAAMHDYCIMIGLCG